MLTHEVYSAAMAILLQTVESPTLAEVGLVLWSNPITGLINQRRQLFRTDIEISPDPLHDHMNTALHQIA